MYFDRYTGKVSKKYDEYKVQIGPRYFPYHNLNGKYVGFRHPCFSDSRQICFGALMKNTKGKYIKYVKTYEEMDW